MLPADKWRKNNEKKTSTTLPYLVPLPATTVPACDFSHKEAFYKMSIVWEAIGLAVDVIY